MTNSRFDITTVSFWSVMSAIGLMAIVALFFAIQWLITPTSRPTSEVVVLVEQPKPVEQPIAQPPPRPVQRPIAPVVQAITEAEPIVEEQFISRFQDIFNAAASGTVQDVKYFLDKGISIEQNGGLNGDLTLLHQAAKFNPNVDVLKYLVLNGADVNVKNGGGWAPIHEAAHHNRNVEILKYLLSIGVDVNTKVDGGNAKNLEWYRNTPLDLANSEEKRQILRAAGGKSGREL